MAIFNTLKNNALPLPSSSSLNPLFDPSRTWPLEARGKGQKMGLENFFLSYRKLFVILHTQKINKKLYHEQGCCWI